MADKWDKLAETILAEVPNEDKAPATVVITILADFCRTVEQMGADMDRIATALEKRNEPQ